MTLSVSGRFADGRTARLYPVQVRFEAGLLTIIDDGGERLAEWHYESLAFADEPSAGRPLRLRLREDDGARLTLDKDASLDTLYRAAPQLHGEPRLSRRRLRRIAVIGAGAAAVGLALAFGVPRLADLAAGAIPVSWEKKFGDAVMREVLRLFSDAGAETAEICVGEKGRAALDRVTQRLLAHVETDYAVTVTVADSGMVNAFALPGGRVVLFRGLLMFSGAGDEVAGVLAHEIAHVVRRDPTRSMIRNMGYGILFDLLIGGGAGSGWAGTVGQILTTTAYSRDAETAADALGADILEAAGIRTHGDVRFFVRLQARYPDLPGALSLLSTHPRTAERIAALKERASDGDPGLDRESWQALNGICRQTEPLE